jgi:hypothetical protein
MPKVIRFLLLILLVTGCKSKPTDNEFEKQLLYDLFPAIVDATCIDVRKYGNLPPPLKNDRYLRFNEEEFPIILDSSLLTVDELSKLALWQQKMDSINADTSRLLIRFNPVLKPIKDIVFAQRFLSDTAPTNTDTASILLNLEGDIIEGRFRITSDVNANTGNRFSLSRILFNKIQTKGIIDVSFSCKGNCGRGYFLLIKKGSNGKWFISKVKQTWIA